MFLQGAYESQLLLTRDKAEHGLLLCCQCVPKSGSVGACSSLPAAKINSFVFFASLCVIICLPEEGTAALSSEHCRPFCRTKAGAQHGTCPQEGMQGMSWHIPSELSMATQGWHLRGHSFLTCSLGAPFSVTVDLLFPTHNHVFFSGVIHSFFLLPSLTLPSVWRLLKLGGLTHSPWELN